MEVTRQEKSKGDINQKKKLNPRPPAGPHKLGPLCFFDPSSEMIEGFKEDIEARSQTMFSHDIDKLGHKMAPPECSSSTTFKSLAAVGTVSSIMDATKTDESLFIDGWLPLGKFPAIDGPYVFLGDYIRFQLATNAALGFCPSVSLGQHYPMMFKGGYQENMRVRGSGAGTAVFWPGWDLEKNRIAWGYLVLLRDSLACGGLARGRYHLKLAHLSLITGRAAFREAPWTVFLQYKNSDVEPDFPDYERLAANEDKAAARKYKEQLCKMDVMIEAAQKDAILDSSLIKVSSRFSPMTSDWAEQFAQITLDETENYQRGSRAPGTAVHLNRHAGAVTQIPEAMQDNRSNSSIDASVVSTSNFPEDNQNGDFDTASRSSPILERGTTQHSQRTAKRRMLADELGQLQKRHKHANLALRNTLEPMIRDLEGQLLESQVPDIESNNNELADWSWASLVIALKDGSQAPTEIAHQAQKELDWLTSYMWPESDPKVVEEAIQLLRQMCVADEAGLKTCLSSTTAKYQTLIEAYIPYSNHSEPLSKLLKDHPQLPSLVHILQRRHPDTADDHGLQEALLVSLALDLDCAMSG